MAKTRDEQLQEARARGIGADELPDDATARQIQDAIAALEPTPDEVAAAAAAAVEGTDKEAFPVQRLIAESLSFFGEPSSVVAGALHGVDGDELTIPEAKAAIKAWKPSTVQEA